MTALVIFVLLFGKISGIWPPPHEIKLEDSATFVIDESFDDDFISDEDEMIPVKKSENREKFFKIHQIALHYNKRELEMKRKLPKVNVTKIPEPNFDLEEDVPWEGGFVDKNGNFIQPDNEKVYYLNEMAKSLIDSKINEKRENEEERTTEADYDYNGFKREYEKEIAKHKKENGTFNYTDVKEEESVGEAVGAVVSLEVKNCSAEENKGIGLAAIKCIANDLRTSNSQSRTIQLLEKILKITLVWICLYILIAIPCWCQRGWCCCCCCCRCCRPRETIEEAKQFFTQNPVGALRTKEGVVEYQPTTYEIYTQKRLEKALFSL